MISARIALVSRDYDKAEAELKRASELAPNRPDPYRHLGYVYAMTNRFELAEASFEQVLETNPYDLSALSSLIRYDIAKRDFSKAIERCQKQLDKTQKSTLARAKIHSLMGRIHLAQKQLDKAEAEFKKALEIDKNLAEPYMMLARIYASQGTLNQAKAQYEAMLVQNENLIVARMGLATIYELEKNHKEAEEQYRKILDVNKQFAPAANNLAWLLSEHGGNIDEALNWAQTAKGVRPEDPAIADTLGWIYYRKGSYRLAMAELEQSVEKLPHNPIVHHHLGIVHERMGNYEEAEQQLQQALEISTKYDGAEQAKELLAKIRKERGGQ
jgi:tetratricopeptide (TPR) repeat protein